MSCLTGVVFCQSSAWLQGTNWFRAELHQGGHIPGSCSELGAGPEETQGLVSVLLVSARCICQFRFTGDFLCLEKSLPTYTMIRADNELHSSVLGPGTGTHATRALSCGPLSKNHTSPSILHLLNLGT